MQSRPLALFVSFYASMAMGLACEAFPVAVAQPAAEVSVEDEAPAAEDEDDEAPDLCAGFSQPGCVYTGCPEGQVCRPGLECVPSLCACDPDSGQSICTVDCEGGTCVDGSLACPPMVCRLLCSWGLEVDEDGCPLCRCKEQPECPCTDHEECMKVVTGCCSCENGGTEVAVAKACASRLAQCPVTPESLPCIAFDRCTKRQAACVAGKCVLQNPL